MGLGTIVHYVGSVLLFIAMILTIIVSVSAPVVDYITFVNLNLPGTADAQFGAFGYCSTRGNGLTTCSDSRIGYDAAKVLESVDDSLDFSTARGESIQGLTHAFVLHPVSTALLLIAFLLSLFSGTFVGSLLAMIASAIAFIVALLAMIVDFAAFSLLLNEVRDGKGGGSYGSAIYMALVATILALLGTLIMFVTCCAGRRRRSREKRDRKAAEQQQY